MGNLFIPGVLVHDRPGEKREARTVSTVVNLRSVRKRKRRDAKEKEAAENRVRFGRSKAERESSAADLSRARRDLDGNRRNPIGAPGDDGPDS